VVTFSVGFGDLINELPYARAVADTYHTDHHEIQMEVPVGELLERMAETYDEPFADSSNIPTYLMAGFARRHVKVVLSGDGGDELFGGYEWYLPLIADNNVRADAAIASLLKVSALAWRVLAKAGFPVRSQRDAAVHAYRTVSNKRRYPDLWDRHLALVTVFNTEERSASWNGGAPRETDAVIREIYGPEPIVEGMDRATDFDVRCYLPGDILVKVDRAAMAHGLETRAPLLDVDLVEFVLSLPNHLRFRDGALKYLLREACRDLWPEVVRNRSKQGFGAPLWDWIRRPDVQALIRRVCTPNSPLRTLLPGVRFPFQHLNPQQVWTMLCLGLWLEKRAGCLNRLS
jgi:asparagine synthase (glutamine-hydrolysing)